MNRLNIRLRLFAVILLIAMLAVSSASAFAVVGDVPTLFHNDEEWYKDGLYPLSVRNGRYYVPAELFAMFDYISVTTPSRDNILIHNTKNGCYASILFKDSTAAINGSIVRDVGVFRDDDVYYVDAEIVCLAIGMDHELYTAENGTECLRIYDSDASLSIEAMVDLYLSDEYDGETAGENQSSLMKRIFLMCKPLGPYSDEYSAQMNLDMYGLDYTLFLTSASNEVSILYAAARGEYGLLPSVTGRIDGVDIANELDRINLSAVGLTGRTSRLTLSTGKDEEDGILRNHGYIPIEPDFTVNGSSDAERVFSEIILRATRDGYCTVYLEDCWNSTRIAELLGEMADPNYTTSNLINANR